MSFLPRPAALRATVGAAVCLAAAAAIATALGPGLAATDPGADVELPPATSAPDPSAITAESEEGVSPSSTAPAASPSTPPGRLPAETPDPGHFEPVTGELDAEDASELVSESLTPPDAGIAPDTEDLEAVLSDLAAGSYRAELEAQWLELSENGWSYSGDPRVVDLEIVSMDDKSDPATAEVPACIDSSDVTLLDVDGQRIGSQDDVVARAAHLFSLVRDDGTWRVASRSFPDDPAC